MTCPGRRLRAICVRLCSDRTMNRLIDPVLADLQAEYADALRRGEVWRSRRVLVAGYVAFLKVATVHGYEMAIQTVRDWPVDDRQALVRTFALSVAAILALTILITLGPALEYPRRHPGRIGLVIYSLPQALPIAVPVGFTLGIFCGLAGRAVSRRLAGCVLAAALACSVVSFATMAWVIPAAGDAFRRSVERQIEKPIALTKGPLELTLGELGRQIDLLEQAGRVREGRKFTHAYQMRWALPLATFMLALLALCVMPRRARGRWIFAVAACSVCFVYYALMAAGEWAGVHGMVPAFVGAWLANIVCAVVSAAVLTSFHRSNAIS